MELTELANLLILPGEGVGVRALCINNPTFTSNPPQPGAPDAQGILTNVTELVGQTWRIRAVTV